MTYVYGGSVEPGGFELEDESTEIECPHCKGKALYRFRELAEGGCINAYRYVYCLECDYEDGDRPEVYTD